jgi:hypothetical protein
MRCLRSFCALLLALLCCCGGADLLCAKSNAAPQKESETIRGTVLNSVTHEPVGRALVYSQDNRFATLTDSAGHFEFKVPSREPERRSERPELFAGPAATPLAEEISRTTTFLEARKPGFLSSQNSYPNTPPTPASPGQKDVTIYLVPAALIAGRVTVADSDSPERIEVEIYRRQIQNGRARWISAGTFTTWSNGEFRFPELSPGAYKLFTRELMDRDPLTFNPRGQLYGYPPVYFPGANNFDAGSTIQLSAGATFEADLTPSRREYYPVELGIANAPEGAPLGVEVSAGSRGGPGYALGYNPQAQKIQGMLPDGSYAVSMSSFGRPGATGTLDLSVKGGAATGYILTMAPNASISVNVTEEFTSAENRGDVSISGPLNVNPGWRGHYIQVSLEPADEIGQASGAGLRQPTGPEDESLVLENVKPGRYWVRVDSPRGFAASIKCGETDLLHHPLVVPAGGSSDPIELTMRDDGAQIDGIIENVPTIPGRSLIQAAQMPPHVYLIPSQDSTGQFREIWVSPDGKFSSQQIPPGDYQVLAFDRPLPELEYRNEEAMRKYHSQEKTIRLVAGQKEELRLHMISGSDER